VPRDITTYLPALYRDTRMVYEFRTGTAKTAPHLSYTLGQILAKLPGPVAGRTSPGSAAFL